MDDWIVNHFEEDLDYVLQIVAVLKNSRWNHAKTWIQVDEYVMQECSLSKALILGEQKEGKVIPPEQLVILALWLKGRDNEQLALTLLDTLKIYSENIEKASEGYSLEARRDIQTQLEKLLEFTKIA